MPTISIRDNNGTTKRLIKELKALNHPENMFYDRSESFIGLYFINSAEALSDVHARMTGAEPSEKDK